MGALTEQEAGGSIPEVLGHLLDMAAPRRALLGRTLDTDELLLRKLGELEAAELRLLTAIAVAQSLPIVAVQFFHLRALRLIRISGGWLRRISAGPR